MNTPRFTQHTAVPRSLVALCLMVLLGLIGCDSDNQADDPLQRELDKLQEAIKPFQDMNAALAAGYTVRATEHVSGMGVHYLNPDLLDNIFEVDKPEVLIYVEQPDGTMAFVAVEFGTPVDLANPGPAPEGFTGTSDVWRIDQQFSLWTLHAWTVLDNPNGIFAPMNPQVP